MDSPAVPRESYSSLGSVFIIGTGGEKSRKKGGNIKKNVQGINVAQWVHERGWVKQWAGTLVAVIPSIIQTNNHQWIWAWCQLGWVLQQKKPHASHPQPLFTTPGEKRKRIGGKEKWMSHQSRKPQLALIMNKTYFLWTLLQLWYPIKHYFKAVGHCCCCCCCFCCSRSPRPLGFLHTLEVIVSLRTKR